MSKSQNYIAKLNQLVVLLSTHSNSQDLQIIRRLVYELKEGLKLLDQTVVTQVIETISTEETPIIEVESPKKKITTKGKKKDNDTTPA